MKKQTTFRLNKPRHYYLQVVYEDGTVKNTRPFCTALAIQNKAEYAATKEGVDIVFVLRGGCDPSSPSTEDIIQRIEPRPFDAVGGQSVKVRFDKAFKVRQVGSETIEVLYSDPTEVYSEVGRYWKSAG